MALERGTRLGPYQIESRIGAGGMGEVYKATDTRLERTVAIKVLPAHVASDPDLKQRFEREAKTISSLNHPHICTLYDVGRSVPTSGLQAPSPPEGERGWGEGGDRLPGHGASCLRRRGGANRPMPEATSTAPVTTPRTTATAPGWARRHHVVLNCDETVAGTARSSGLRVYTIPFFMVSTAYNWTSS